MESLDADYRYMALNDLTQEISLGKLTLDESTECKLVPALLKMLQDNNGEVKTMAVKTTAFIVKALSIKYYCKVMENLAGMLKGTREDQIEMAIIAFKLTMQSSSNKQLIESRLVDNVIPILMTLITSKVATTDMIDLMNEMLFKATLSSVYATQEVRQSELLGCLFQTLANPRSTIRKRAVSAFAALIPLLNDKIFDGLTRETTQRLADVQGHDEPQLICTLQSLVATLTKLKPERLNALMPKLVETALDTLETNDDDDVKESSIQLLDVFVSSCPTSTSQLHNRLFGVLSDYIKYDPNYVGAGDDDLMDQDDYYDDLEDDSYNDDDDISWRVRKACVKLLVSTFKSNPREILDLYNIITEILVPRLSEREETVRLDVVDALSEFVSSVTRTLLDIEGKKKLESKTLTLSTEISAISGQLSLKSVDISCSVLRLLRNLALSCKNCFGPNLTNYLGSISNLLNSSSPGVPGAPSSIKSNALAFLRAIFETHSLSEPSSNLTTCLNILISLCNDVSLTIVSETVETLTLFIVMVEKNNFCTHLNQSSVDQLNDLLLQLSMGRQSDVEIKNKSLIALAKLICVFSNSVNVAHVQQNCLPLFAKNLADEVTLVNGLAALSILLDKFSPDNLTPIVRQVTAELVKQLPKQSRVLRLESLTCLAKIIEIGHFLLPQETESVVKDSLYVFSGHEQDLQIAKQTLNLFSLIIVQSTDKSNSKSGFQSSDQSTLDPNNDDTHQSTLEYINTVINPAILDCIDEHPSYLPMQELKNYWRTWASKQSLYPAERVFNELMQRYQCNTLHSTFTCPVISPCIATVFDCVFTAQQPQKSQRKRSRDQLNWHQSTIESLISGSSDGDDNVKYFNLHLIGDIGALSDICADFPELFDDVVRMLTDSSDTVKQAAAYCLGNIVLGNIEAHADKLLGLLQQTNEDPELKRLLLLAFGQLVALPCNAQTLLETKPSTRSIMYQVADFIPNNQESTRLMAAECISTLLKCNFHACFDAFLEKIESGGSNFIICLLIALGICSSTTLSTDPTSISYLRSKIPSLLVLLNHQDILVRKSMLSLYNILVYQQPAILESTLDIVLPLLFREASVKPELVRIVEMGPFKHKVDEGLELRKCAFESILALVENIPDISRHVTLFSGPLSAGLEDPSPEIRMLVHLTLQKLSLLAPEQLSSNATLFINGIQAEMNQKPKANAVKQEIERLHEIQRSALKLAIVFTKTLSNYKLQEWFEGIVQKHSDLMSELTLEVENLIENRAIKKL